MEENKMPDEIPIEKVINMRGQGLTNNQIVQALQREGYTLDQVNNAINQSELKEGVMPTQFAMQGGAPPQGMPPGVPTGAPGMMAPAEMPMAPAPANDERIHEIAEAIIEEKWSSLLDNVNSVIEWKDTTTVRIAKIEQQMSDLQASFDRLHEGVLGKISDYDKGLKEIGTDIKALEKVFQKILPGFVENVSELSRITSTMKKAKK